MPVRPDKLALLPDGRLRIAWNDGTARVYRVRELRDACPCATCREQRAAPPKPAPLLQVLSAAETRPLKLQKMSPVGNYAYSLDFGDGHTAGIFTLELLQRLGTLEPAAPAV